MNKDQVIGLSILLGSILGIILYAWLVFISPWDWLVLRLTAFLVVGGILGILVWIGYTLTTTPPPRPIEEIEKELQDEFNQLEEKEIRKGEENQKGQ